jgi:hypothetical protein
MSNNKEVDSGLSAPVDDNEGGAQPCVSEGDEAAIETQPQNSSIQDHESQPEEDSTQDHESQPNDRVENDDDHPGTGVESADGKELIESPKSEQEGGNAAEVEPAQSMDGDGEVAPEAKAVPALVKPKDPEEVKRDILALYQQVCPSVASSSGDWLCVRTSCFFCIASAIVAHALFLAGPQSRLQVSAVGAAGLWRAGES